MKWIKRLRDYFLSDNYPDPTENRKITLTFYLLLFGGIATLILPFVYVAIGFQVGLIFSTFGTLLAVGMLIGIRKGVNYITLGNFCAFSVVLDLGALVVFTGGIHSPALIWLLFAPITGYLLTNNLSGRIWSLVTFIFIITLAIFFYQSVPIPNFISPDYFPIVMVINFVMSISILLFIVFSYERAQENAITNMEALNRELQKKSHEAEDLNRNLEMKVERRTMELKRMNEELDHFSYSISHNLRAPLTSILGLVDLIDRDPENAREYLELIRTSTSKLDETIHTINTYLKGNRSEIEKVEIGVEEEVKGIIEDLSFSQHARELNFSVTVDPELKLVTDPSKFRMIVSNILSNAIKYSDFEKESSFVKVDACSNGSKVKISVEDNGIGILPEKREKVFEMFYRGTELSKGDGLGLYIVKEAIERMGGSVGLKSEESKGSTFEVSFPN